MIALAACHYDSYEDNALSYVRYISSDDNDWLYSSLKQSSTMKLSIELKSCHFHECFVE